MKQEGIGINDILTLLQRNLILYVLWIMLAVGIAVACFLSFPKKYKATGQLNIHSSYFQNPLVNDLISEVHDPSERISQRTALLLLALTDKFIDHLGEKYNIYKSESTNQERAFERESLRKQIEFFSVNRNAFQISVVSNQANTAYLMTQDVIKKMIDTAMEERSRTLVQTKEALEESLQSLGNALQGSSGPLASFQESLKQEQEEIRANIRALRSQFTEQHPDIQKLRKREQSITLLLKQAQQASSGNVTQNNNEILNSDSKKSTQDVYNELLKKLSYLHIAIQLNKDKGRVNYLSVIQQPSIPSQAFFPRLDVFCLIGFVVGNLLALISIVISEMRRGSFLDPEVAAMQYGTELLVSIPKLSGGKKLPILETVSENAIATSLSN